MVALDTGRRSNRQSIDYCCPLSYRPLMLLQVITLEGELEEEVAAAADSLEAALPKDFVVKVVADDDLKDV